VPHINQPFLARPRAGLLLAALAALPASASNDLPHYRLSLEIDPARQYLHTNAEVELPAALAGQTIEFLLTSKLEIVASEPEVELLPGAGSTGFRGINGGSVELESRNAINRYRVTLPPESSRLTLHYAGLVDDAPAQVPEEYTRSFMETPGVIEPRGVYLAGSTLWYPYLGEDLVTFELTVNVPDGWHLVSQGNGTSRDEEGLARWDSGGAVDEIYLVGGPLLLYSEPAGAIEAQVFLRTPDDNLAARYLSATARYIELYRNLIGPYPYGKFALVENFWETGYGMPSFTLLGPQIIRFPFILTSSYPHEILHNWWGNSVFVDYQSGNWAEGLTAYLADHLMKEIEGQGAAYRRDTLKKYRDFVSADRDFPLSEFRSRHSAATEAVGYGKTLMGFHMLRLRIGDDSFRRGLAQFYRSFRGQRASFADLKLTFEEVSGENLERFFDEWVTRPGAAELALGRVTARATAAGWELRGVLLQRQTGPLDIAVPVVVATAEGSTTRVIRSAEVETPFVIETASEPLALAVDPAFDVFRLLDARETAPSLGQLFGDPRVTAVLPSRPDSAAEAWRQMVATWQGGPLQDIEVVLDSDIDSLPADRSVWLLGRENRLAREQVTASTAIGFGRDDGTVTLAGSTLPFAGHAHVVVRRHPADATRAMAWIAADEPALLPALARRLPHFGKYSYLSFAGDEGTVAAQGEWPAADSPLTMVLREGASLAALEPEEREPLAQLPPVFSQGRLLDHVRFLADPAREGRGVGTRGLEESARYIAEQFAAAGLRPGGEEGGWFQPFRIERGPDGRPHDIKNVIGYLPGTRSEFAGEAALVTAHYDHLGLGWPDVRASAQRQLHPGADDNASGVAVLLELARAFAEGPRPERSIVFVAFSAEEAGLVGSRHYVQNPLPVAREGIVGVLNMDTVGRLGGQPLQVLATDSAREWPFVFRGISFMTGIETRIIGGAAESSDQMAFIEAGIPGVQLFTAAHEDYHRPTDTADKIDGAGLVKVAMVAREAVAYLASTESRPTPAMAAPGAPDPDAPRERRRVSFGTVPDFGHTGAGMRVESVIADSPAGKVGLTGGDVITRMGDQEIVSLGGYNQVLGSFSPGDRITVTWLRDGQEMSAEVELVAR
jgi:aminopeptidase N